MQCFIYLITLYNVCSISSLFVLLYFLSYSYLIADCLLVFSELEFFFFCDIDTGDKNYEISMVSKILIS